MGPKLKAIRSRQLFAVFTLATFLATGLPVPLPQSYAAEIPSGLRVPAELSQLTIPSELGTIQEISLTKLDKAAPFVIHIQDAHAVYDAQKNIRGIVAYLQREFGLSLVALEGAVGELDPVLFRTFPGEKVKEAVFDRLMEKGELSGADAAAILNREWSHFVGIEEKDLYLENREGYLRAVKAKDHALEAVEKALNENRKEKSRAYSSELLEFEERTEAYEAHPEKVLEVLEWISQFEVGATEYPKLSLVIREIVRDRKLERHEREQRDVELMKLASLVKEKLDPDQLKEYGPVTEAFRREGRRKEFIQFLGTKARERGISLDPYKRFLKEEKTQAVIASMEGETFFSELHSLIDERKEALFRSEAERALDQEANELKLFRGLASLELTRNELKRVLSLSEFSSHPAGGRPHLNLAGQTGSAGRAPGEASASPGVRREKWKELKTGLRPALQFYELALKRDRILFNNFTQEIKNRKAPLAVVVTGGFHTEGIKSLLKEAGYPYAVIAPRIERLGESRYLDVMLESNPSYKSYLKAEPTPETSQIALMDLLSPELIGRERWEVIKRAWATELVHGVIGRDEPIDPSEPFFRRWRDAIVTFLVQYRFEQKSDEYVKVLQEIHRDFLSRFPETRLPNQKAAIEALTQLIQELAGRRQNRSEIRRSYQEFIGAVSENVGRLGAEQAVLRALEKVRRSPARSELRANGASLSAEQGIDQMREMSEFVHKKLTPEAFSPDKRAETDETFQRLFRVEQNELVGSIEKDQVVGLIATHLTEKGAAPQVFIERIVDAVLKGEKHIAMGRIAIPFSFLNSNFGEKFANAFRDALREALEKDMGSGADRLFGVYKERTDLLIVAVLERALRSRLRSIWNQTVDEMVERFGISPSSDQVKLLKDFEFASHATKDIPQSTGEVWPKEPLSPEDPNAEYDGEKYSIRHYRVTYGLNPDYARILAEDDYRRALRDWWGKVLAYWLAKRDSEIDSAARSDDENAKALHLLRAHEHHGKAAEADRQVVIEQIKKSLERADAGQSLAAGEGMPEKIWSKVSPFLELDKGQGHFVTDEAIKSVKRFLLGGIKEAKDEFEVSKKKLAEADSLKQEQKKRTGETERDLTKRWKDYSGKVQASLQKLDLYLTTLIEFLEAFKRGRKKFIPPGEYPSGNPPRPESLINQLRERDGAPLGTVPLAEIEEKWKGLLNGPVTSEQLGEFRASFRRYELNRNETFVRAFRDLRYPGVYRREIGAGKVKTDYTWGYVYNLNYAEEMDRIAHQSEKMKLLKEYFVEIGQQELADSISDSFFEFVQGDQSYFVVRDKEGDWYAARIEYNSYNARQMQRREFPVDQEEKKAPIDKVYYAGIERNRRGAYFEFMFKGLASLENIIAYFQEYAENVRQAELKEGEPELIQPSIKPPDDLIKIGKTDRLYLFTHGGNLYAGQTKQPGGSPGKELKELYEVDPLTWKVKQMPKEGEPVETASIKIKEFNLSEVKPYLVPFAATVTFRKLKKGEDWGTVFDELEELGDDIHKIQRGENGLSGKFATVDEVVKLALERGTPVPEKYRARSEARRLAEITPEEAEEHLRAFNQAHNFDLMARVKRFVKTHPGHPVRILDLGSGSEMRLLRILKKEFKDSVDVLGVDRDRSPPAQDLKRFGLRYSSREGSKVLRELAQEQKEQFDIILSHRAFAFFENKTESLQNIKQLLAPGGWASIHVFQPEKNLPGGMSRAVTQLVEPGFEVNRVIGSFTVEPEFEEPGEESPIEQEVFSEILSIQRIATRAPSRSEMRGETIPNEKEFLLLGAQAHSNPVTLYQATPDVVRVGTEGEGFYFVKESLRENIPAEVKRVKPDQVLYFPESSFKKTWDNKLILESGPHTVLAILMMLDHREAIRDNTVFDLGHGKSGILTILALRLGAKKVVAIESDPKAKEPFERALQVNGADLGKVTQFSGTFRQAFSKMEKEGFASIEGKFPVFIANVSIETTDNLFRNDLAPIYRNQTLTPFYLISGGLGEALEYPEEEWPRFYSWLVEPSLEEMKQGMGLTNGTGLEVSGFLTRWSDTGHSLSFGFSVRTHPARAEVRKNISAEEISLIIVHSADGNTSPYVAEGVYDHDKVTQAPIESILKEGYFGRAFEYQAAGHPTNISPEFERNVVSQVDADYRIKDLKGRIFILTGGGYNACHLCAFENLAEHSKKSPEEQFEIHLPANAIYWNIEKYEDGDKWMETWQGTLDYLKAKIDEPDEHGKNGEPDWKHSYLARLTEREIPYEVISFEGGELISIHKSGATPRVLLYLWPDTESMSRHLKERLQPTSDEVHSAPTGPSTPQYPRRLGAGAEVRQDPSGPKARGEVRNEERPTDASLGWEDLSRVAERFKFSKKEPLAAFVVRTTEPGHWASMRHEFGPEVWSSNPGGSVIPDYVVIRAGSEATPEEVLAQVLRFSDHRLFPDEIRKPLEKVKRAFSKLAREKAAHLLSKGRARSEAREQSKGPGPVTPLSKTNINRRSEVRSGKETKEPRQGKGFTHRGKLMLLGGGLGVFTLTALGIVWWGSEESEETAGKDLRIGTLVRDDLLLLRDGFHSVWSFENHLSQTLDSRAIRTFAENVLEGRQPLHEDIGRAFSKDLPAGAYKVGLKGKGTPEQNERFRERAKNLVLLMRVLSKVVPKHQADELEELRQWAGGDEEAFVEILKRYEEFTGVVINQALLRNREWLETGIQHERLHAPLDAILYEAQKSEDPRFQQRQLLLRGLQVFLREGGFAYLWALFGTDSQGRQTVYTQEVLALQQGNLSFANEFWTSAVYPSLVIVERREAYERFMGAVNQLSERDPAFKEALSLMRELKKESDAKAKADLQALKRFARSEVHPVARAEVRGEGAQRLDSTEVKRTPSSRISPFSSPRVSRKSLESLETASSSRVTLPLTTPDTKSRWSSRRLFPWTATSSFSSLWSKPVWPSAMWSIFLSIDSRRVPTSVIVYGSVFLLSLPAFSFFIGNLLLNQLMSSLAHWAARVPLVGALVNSSFINKEVQYHQNRVTPTPAAILRLSARKAGARAEVRSAPAEERVSEELLKQVRSLIEQKLPPLDRDSLLSGEEAPAKLLLFSRAYQYYSKHAFLNPSTPEERQKLLELSLKTQRAKDSGWETTKKTLQFLKEEFAFEFEKLPLNRKKPLLNLTAGIGRGGEARFAYWQAFLKKLEERFSFGPFPSLTPRARQRIATAAYYVARGKMKRETTFNATLTKIQELFGLEDLKTLPQEEKLRLIAAAYHVALAKEGLSTFTQTIEKIQELFGLEDLKTLPQEEKLRLITAAYAVALQEGLLTFTEALTREISKAAKPVNELPLKEKIELVTRSYPHPPARSEVHPDPTDPGTPQSSRPTGTRSEVRGGSNARELLDRVTRLREKVAGRRMIEPEIVEAIELLRDLVMAWPKEFKLQMEIGRVQEKLIELLDNFLQVPEEELFNIMEKEEIHPSVGRGAEMILRRRELTEEQRIRFEKLSGQVFRAVYLLINKDRSSMESIIELQTILLKHPSLKRWGLYSQEEDLSLTIGESQVKGLAHVNPDVLFDRQIVVEGPFERYDFSRAMHLLAFLLPLLTFAGVFAKDQVEGAREGLLGMINERSQTFQLRWDGANQSVIVDWNEWGLRWTLKPDKRERSFRIVEGSLRKVLERFLGNLEPYRVIQKRDDRLEQPRSEVRTEKEDFEPATKFLLSLRGLEKVTLVQEREGFRALVEIVEGGRESFEEFKGEFFEELEKRLQLPGEERLSQVVLDLIPDFAPERLREKLVEVGITIDTAAQAEELSNKLLAAFKEINLEANQMTLLTAKAEEGLRTLGSSENAPFVASAAERISQKILGAGISKKQPSPIRVLLRVDALDPSEFPLLVESLGLNRLGIVNGEIIVYLDSTNRNQLELRKEIEQTLAERGIRNGVKFDTYSNWKVGMADIAIAYKGAVAKGYGAIVVTPEMIREKLNQALNDPSRVPQEAIRRLMNETTAALAVTLGRIQDSDSDEARAVVDTLRRNLEEYGINIQKGPLGNLIVSWNLERLIARIQAELAGLKATDRAA